MQTTQTMTTVPTVEHAGTTVVLGDTFKLTAEQAGNLGHALLRLRDELTPAGEDGLRALSVALDAINDARGTSHTVDSVADSLGMERPLSQAEASEIARHIGGALMH